ncbi:MAG: hypothetical protein ACOC3I_06865 [Verrucomicrobiota bacterium]
MLLLAPLSGVVHGQEKAPAWTYTGDLAERAAENSVVLAVRKAASILPDPVLLERLREDLLSIYAMEPGLAAAWAWPAWADAVLVRLEPEASLDEFVAALPAAWEATAEERPGVPWDLIRFRRPLQVGLAADHIAGLEGVVSAEPNFIGGDGGDVHWHPEVDLYVFEIGWGDCPAVCIHHDYRFVVLTTEGPVEIEGAAARELIGLEPPRGVPAEIRAAAGDRLTVGPDTLSDPWIGWPQAVEPQGGFFGPYELVLRGPYGFDAEPVRFAVRERGGSPVLGHAPGLRLAAARGVRVGLGSILSVGLAPSSWLALCECDRGGDGLLGLRPGTGLDLLG